MYLHFVPSVCVCAIHFTGREFSSEQYTLECKRNLYFAVGQSEECYNYNITDDQNCELHERTTHFKLRLSLSSTTNLRIDSFSSEAIVTIDDSNEPECCKCFCCYVVYVDTQ